MRVFALFLESQAYKGVHNDSEECLSFAGARYGLYVVRFLVWLGLAISYAHGPNSLRYSPPALRWRICVSPDGDSSG